MVVSAAAWLRRPAFQLFCSGAVGQGTSRRAPRLPVARSSRRHGAGACRCASTHHDLQSAKTTAWRQLGVLWRRTSMFANADHPVGDAAFHAEIDAEVDYQPGASRRTPASRRTAAAAKSRQAACSGCPRRSGAMSSGKCPARAHRWLHPPFRTSSTPWGGAHRCTSAPNPHYYGVGASAAARRCASSA